MKLVLLVLAAFVFGVMIIYQIGSGFPLLQKYRDKKRQKHNDEIARTKKENQEKIKLLDKQLRGEGDIELYVSLNRFNLPDDEKWRILLPRMIEELLEIGWTTDMPIYTKLSYWQTNITLSIPDKDLKEQAYEILHKYYDEYDDMFDVSNEPPENKKSVKRYFRKNRK